MSARPGEFQLFKSGTRQTTTRAGREQFLQQSHIPRCGCDEDHIKTKEPQHWGLSITNNDLLTGSLAYDSYVQIDAIHSLEKSIIHAVIETLKSRKMNAIKIQVSALLSLDTPVP